MDAAPPRLPSLFLIPPTLVLVGIVLFVALLHRRGDLVVLPLLVLSVAAGTALWARRARSGLAARLAVDRARLFPGEALRLTAGVENRRCLPVALQVSVPVGGLGPGGEPTVRQEGGLLWYQRAEFAWTLTAPRRGVHRVGPLTAAAGDPFGFFTADLAAGETREVIVYPRVRPLSRLPLPRRDFFGVPGAESPVRDPVYVLGTRDYQPGAPAKHIHWKATARHHRLQEKVFEPTQQAKVLLALDVEGYAREGAEAEFEEAVEAVASLAARLDQEGCAVGLLANGLVAGAGAAVLPIRRAADQLPAILERLARLRMAPAGKLHEMARDAGSLTWGVSVVCVALEQDAAAEAAHRSFTQRHVPAVLFVSRVAPAGPVADGRPGAALLRTLLSGAPS